MSRVMHLRATAMWSLASSDAGTGLAANAVPAASTPAAQLLPRRMRGRASLLTSMLAEVVAGVARDGDVDVSAVPMIIGSAFGEMATTAQLLDMMNRDDGVLSPARFQASVHNTAAGQISIATGNRGFSTCVAAGAGTCAAVLLEAFAWLASHGGDVIAAVADESLPEFFGSEPPYGPLAGALLLSSEAPSGRAVATLGSPQYDAAAVDPRRQRMDDPTVSCNPVASWLDVLAAVAAGRHNVIVLPSVSGSWRFEFVPGEAAR